MVNPAGSLIVFKGRAALASVKAGKDPSPEEGSEEGVSVAFFDELLQHNASMAINGMILMICIVDKFASKLVHVVHCAGTVDQVFLPIFSPAIVPVYQVEGGLNSIFVAFFRKRNRHS